LLKLKQNSFEINFLQNLFNFLQLKHVPLMKINFRDVKFSRLILCKISSPCNWRLKCAVDEINFRDVKFSRLISLQNFFNLQLRALKMRRWCKISRLISLQNFFSILQLALKCKTVDEINFRDVKFSRLISLQNSFTFATFWR
jgi:hypothetical protein